MFSPDGNLLYYGAGPAGLFAIPTLGGTTKLINSNVDSGISFSPDGKQFAFVRFYPRRKEATIFIANSDGSGERKIASRVQPRSYAPSVAWSPDGKTLVCPALDVSPTGQTTTIVALPASGGNDTPITDKTWTFATDVRWLAHGHGIVVIGEDRAFSPTQAWYIPYPKGAAERITKDLNHYSGLAFTADSSAFVTVQLERKSSICVTGASGDREGVQVTSGAAKMDGLYGVAWTPDERIAYASRAGSDWDIWIAQADGGNPRQIFTRGIDPRVSPDGKYIVFSTDRNAGGPHIWRMDTNGDRPVRLTDGEGEFAADCCVEGKWVVFSRLGPKGDKLWKVPLDGGDAEPLVDAFARAAVISPDSTRVAFNYIAAPPPLVRGVAVARPQAGAIEARFPIRNNDPSDVHVSWRPMGWRPDSQAIYYLRDVGGMSNIWQQPLDGEAPSQVSRFTRDRIFSFAVSRDGKRLALARGSVTSDVILIRNAP